MKRRTVLQTIGAFLFSRSEGVDFTKDSHDVLIAEPEKHKPKFKDLPTNLQEMDDFADRRIEPGERMCSYVYDEVATYADGVT